MVRPIGVESGTGALRRYDARHINWYRSIPSRPAAKTPRNLTWIGGLSDPSQFQGIEMDWKPYRPGKGC